MRKNLLNNRFGKLVVKAVVPDLIKYHTRYLCVCDCGTEKEVDAKHLISGRTKSCGCFSKENAKLNATLNKSCVVKTHGMSESSEYIIWLGIKARCLRKSISSKNYKDRGITICDRWMKFENFISDMGKRPSMEFSVDRIDNSKGYSPDNCRWATSLEQASNKRNNRLITFNGKTKHQAEWAREVGLKIATLHARLKSGWTIERALFTNPSDYHNKNKLPRAA